jgi:hypothetical protein
MVLAALLVSLLEIDVAGTGGAAQLLRLDEDPEAASLSSNEPP